MGQVVMPQSSLGWESAVSLNSPGLVRAFHLQTYEKADTFGQCVARVFTDF